ncbi:hypothetical protein LEP1GSC086_3640 [Leptospira weilii str. LNT 1234]|nr:hypothetical protein LEP1GSC086_3640 [Leptospira weilii str. LNT 1234]
MFAKTIQTENHNVDEQLNQTMAYDGFARLGAAYVRMIKTASGGDEVQTLGTYQYYNYNPPTVFPEVKDSNGQSWDLGKPELLIDREKVPSASDLTVMVRLAKNKMSADFKKVFDPSLDKRRNYEAEKGLFDPTEVQASFNEYLDAVKSGESVSCLGKSAEQCAKSAMNSGFLVGEVAEGSFGEAQFNQFYIILKTKKEMDKRKGKMDAARHRKQGGMGRFYNQLGAMGEGLGEAVKGAGSAALSAAKASLKATTDFNGAKKDLKEAGKQGERALQGALYATSGAMDFVMFFADTVVEGVLGIFSGGILNMQNTGLDGKFAEGNYELAKFRDTNRAQKHLNELGMRTGAEMYANDAALDKVVTTTLAVAGIFGAILSFTPFAPVGVGLLAVSALGTAGWKTFRGAYEGGAAGMLAGAVSGVANSALDYATNGVVGMNMSYSYANGFGVGISVGTSNSTQLGGSIGVNYNAKSGAWGASVGLKAGFGGKTKGNFSNWAEVGYNRNNIGRDNQSSGVSANIRGQYNQYGSISQYGSLGLSYDTKAGYGATLGLSSGFGPVSVSPSFNVSEYGGFNTDVQYGVNENFFDNVFNKTNNPNHASANRNLLDDILYGAAGLIGGIGRGAKSAWDSVSELFGGGDGNANALDMEYAEMQEQMNSMMDGDALADNNGMPSANKLSLAKVGRLKTEIDAYLDYKEGKISKGDFEAKVAEARKNYYYQTQDERNKIPVGKDGKDRPYTDISLEKLNELVRLEAKEGVIGRIVKGWNDVVYFRAEALGMKSRSIQMEETTLTNKPWTKVDPHNQNDFPGWVDLYGPIGSGITVPDSDDKKFKVVGLTIGSEGGNLLTLQYLSKNKTVEVTIGHIKNEFPSYVIDQLKAGGKPTFDVGTVVAWIGATGQRGIGTDGRVQYDPAQHTHNMFKQPNKTGWRNWQWPGMGY